MVPSGELYVVKAGVVCLQVKLCDPHPSALEVRFSRLGAIQIYVYLYLTFQPQNHVTSMIFQVTSLNSWDHSFLSYALTISVKNRNLTLTIDLSTLKHVTSRMSQDYSLYQVWILWELLFLSYAADKQTNKQTAWNVVFQPTYRVGMCNNCTNWKSFIRITSIDTRLGFKPLKLSSIITSWNICRKN